ncbi:MAG TPA: glucose-6-phosphate isomerase [Bacteroidales bacterium]|nr:glucose-6-phosphate isomerase [Bacteroidales bacterium]
MANLEINVDRILNFVDENILESLQQEIDIHYRELTEKKGRGSDFLGWLTLAEETLRSGLLKDITEEAEKLRATSEVVVVIGIGGSYLGSRAIIESLNNQFQQYQTGNPEIIYAGHHISEEYLVNLLQFLNNKDYSIIVISKSGTTTEPALAFRFLKKHLENKYGKENASKRIIAITDKSRGALKKLAEKEGYSTFIIPDDVGGRFSVLTPVGLLPVAVAGFEITKLVEGAAAMQQELFKTSSIAKNPACLYVAARNALYRSGKPVEMLVNFQPNLFYITEWWKQLFGESEGKDHKGIFPAGASFSTDLHSMGQYIQDGLRILFETMLLVEKPGKILTVPLEQDDADGLNYLAGKRISEVNNMAAAGTAIAHHDGGVPVISIRLTELNEFTLGELIYFFEFACGISGYMLEVNPFDQPGVEAYKNNMFALLGKTGYEEQQKEILKKIK